MKKMLLAAALVLLVLYLAPTATMLGKPTALDLPGECYTDGWEKAGHGLRDSWRVNATRGGETMTIVRLLLRGIFDILVTLLVAAIFGALLIAVSNIAEGADSVPGQCGAQSRTAGCSN
jgi:hypothetical protein